MKEITVTSPLGQFASVQIEDDRADAYIEKHSQAGTWGKPEHWTLEPIKGAETRVNEFGETEYKLEAEFTVTVRDITEEMQAREQQRLWDNMRNERNKRLIETDYIVLRDSPFGFFEKRKWKTYRQELRDLPSKIEDINNFEWPVKPSEEKEKEDENVE